MKKKVNKKTKRRTKKKTRRQSLPFGAAELRRLGLECDSLTEADAFLQKTDIRGQRTKGRKDLDQILEKYPKLKAAWERGRFLRNLREVAAVSLSVSKAARRLGLSNGQVLRELLDNDKEVADIWNQEQLQLYIDTQKAVTEEAKEGKAWAIRIVDNFFQSEDDRKHETGSLERLTTNQLAELTGRTRQTIYEWHTKFGLPRNSDQTFDLHDFIQWFEDFIINKISKGKETTGIDRWKSLRSEKLDLELKKHRNELLDRNEVLSELIARNQILANWSGQKADELARLCQGQKPERIAELIKESFIELRWEFCHAPEELKLPQITAELFQKTLQSLNNSDSEKN